MKKLKIILVLMACITLYACPSKEDGHRYITFVNNSEREIVCQQFWSGSITNADTLFQCRIVAMGIFANSSHNFSSASTSGWEIDFQLIPCIQYSVMDADIFYKYITKPCDTVRKYVPILHCYQLKLEDLQRMNWTVVYPPE